jgi:hypothetical protein
MLVAVESIVRIVQHRVGATEWRAAVITAVVLREA